MTEVERKKVPAKLWDTSGWRVLPQENRGGDAFGLTVPADDETLKRALAGRKNPTKDKWTRTPAGSIAKRVPASSVGWLLDRGWIEKAGRVVAE